MTYSGLISILFKDNKPRQSVKSLKGLSAKKISLNRFPQHIFMWFLEIKFIDFLPKIKTSRQGGSLILITCGIEAGKK